MDHQNPKMLGNALFFLFDCCKLFTEPQQFGITIMYRFLRPYCNSLNTYKKLFNVLLMTFFTIVKYLEGTYRTEQK